MDGKKIYVVYRDRNREIHCESRSLIYSNHKYIYFKEPGNDALKQRAADAIYKNLSDFMESHETAASWYSLCIYLTEKPSQEDIQKYLIVEEKERRLAEAKRQMDAYYAEYLHYKSMYEMYEKEANNQENVSKHNEEHSC